MRQEPDGNLIHLDPEIERTLKRIRRDKREGARMEQLPMGPMEENRDDDVGSTRGSSIHPDAENMDNLLPPIRDYGRPSVVTCSDPRARFDPIDRSEPKPGDARLLLFIYRFIKFSFSKELRPESPSRPEEGIRTEARFTPTICIYLVKNVLFILCLFKVQLCRIIHMVGP